MKEEILTSPYDLVATALDASRDSVNDLSAMGVHPNWDSINHLSVIVALETEYHITIPNNEIMKYDNMKTILELYENKTGRGKKKTLRQRIGEFFKRFKF